MEICLWYLPNHAIVSDVGSASRIVNPNVKPTITAERVRMNKRWRRKDSRNFVIRQQRRFSFEIPIFKSDMWYLDNYKGKKQNYKSVYYIPGQHIDFIIKIALIIWSPLLLEKKWFKYRKTALNGVKQRYCVKLLKIDKVVSPCLLRCKCT